MSIPIAFLITELSVGGAQSALWRLLKGINRKRYSPFVGCLFNGNGTTAQAIRALDISVFDAGMRHKADWGALLRIYQWLRTFRPMILHTSLFHANLIGRVIGRLAGVPIILCSERTMAMEPPWRYQLNRLTINWVDGVIAVSEKVREFCISQVRLPSDKIRVIYNGVETTTTSPKTREQARQELGLPSNGVVIGAVLRLEPVKGADDLLHAFAHILKRSQAWLTIIGDGREREALHAMARQLGIDSHLIWAGYRDQAMDLLPAFDIFVQPSWHEGLPNAVLEAMASAVPVVATAVGGTPEVIIDGENGLLMSPRNPNALAEAISRLINDPELRYNLGQMGRRRVEQCFTLETMVLKTEELYEGLLRERGFTS